jgi:hypothetical protein
MGFARALYFPVNDANTASRGLAEAIGGRGRVLYHCFDKHLGRSLDNRARLSLSMTPCFTRSRAEAASGHWPQPPAR